LARELHALSVELERRASMRWAHRLNPVFGIDIETCAARRGGEMRIIACSEDPASITYW